MLQLLNIVFLVLVAFGGSPVFGTPNHGAIKVIKGALSAVPVSEYTDGQPQVTVPATYAPIVQLSNGQPRATAATITSHGLSTMTVTVTVECSSSHTANGPIVSSTLAPSGSTATLSSVSALSSAALSISSELYSSVSFILSSMSAELSSMSVSSSATAVISSSASQSDETVSGTATPTGSPPGPNTTAPTAGANKLTDTSHVLGIAMLAGALGLVV